MKTYTDHLGWPIEAAKMEDGRWGVALGTEPFAGRFATAAKALAAGKVDAEKRDRRAFEARVRDALLSVGIGYHDWRWLRGRDALVLPHDRDVLGEKLAENAELALSAYTESADGDVEPYEVRGGTRFEFHRWALGRNGKPKRLPDRRAGS